MHVSASGVISWDRVDLGDDRLREGFSRMLAARAKSPGRPAGWKIGWNEPVVRRRLNVGSSVIGYLCDDRLQQGDQVVSITGMRLVGAEAELALLLKADLPAGASREAAFNALGSVAPAIEVIHVNGRFDDVADALANNLWHASAVLGDPVDLGDADLEHAVLTITRNARSAGRPAPVVQRLGDPAELLAFVADSAGLLSEPLRAGDVVLSGLLAPFPVWVKSGDEVAADFGPVGRVAVEFSDLEMGAGHETG